MTHTKKRIKADGRGRWFILFEGDDIDDANVSGEWIKTQHPVELRQ